MVRREIRKRCKEASVLGRRDEGYNSGGKN